MGANLQCCSHVRDVMSPNDDEPLFPVRWQLADDSLDEPNDAGGTIVCLYRLVGADLRFQILDRVPPPPKSVKRPQRLRALLGRRTPSLTRSPVPPS